MGDRACSGNAVIVPYPNHFYAIQRAVHPFRVLKGPETVLGC
jgi:hypothetical protein